MRRRSLFLTLVVAVVAAAPAGAQPDGARIVNGTLTSDYPTTGALLYQGGSPATSDDAYLNCSGTLIGCETFLTASHCLEGDGDPSHYLVFLQHAGFLAVTSIAIHPAYPQADATGDIAVLKLGTPVTGIAPSPINAGAEVPFGTEATIVGFGLSSGLLEDYGLKRAGRVTTSDCGTAGTNATSLCWDFDDPLGPPGTDSNVCNADSGGPLFVDNGCGLTVAGDTSYAFNAVCLTPDTGVDASVFGHLAFVQSAGGTDLDNRTCGSISHVGDDNTTTHAFTGSLSAGTPQAGHAFVVPSGMAELRIALNAIDDGTANYDLYVRRGSPPTTSTFDCAHTGSNQYGYCEVASPVADTWHVLVDRVAGAGPYQITATTFAPTVGSFPTDGGGCEDGDSCSTGDTCNANVCTAGSAVPDTTPCDDGSLCTAIDACLAGACVGDATPRTTCTSPPGKASLLLKESDRPKRNKLVWKWQKGPAITIAEIGDPTSGGSSYTLCLYDESASGQRVALSATAPAGGTCRGKPCWRQLGSASSPKGYRYNDRERVADGIQKILLRAGEAGKAQLQVVAKGVHLPLTGATSATQYFDQDPRVTAQLVQDGGDCWSVAYESASKNTPDQFKTKCGSATDPCP